MFVFQKEEEAEEMHGNQLTKWLLLFFFIGTSSFFAILIGSISVARRSDKCIATRVMPIAKAESGVGYYMLEIEAELSVNLMNVHSRVFETYDPIAPEDLDEAVNYYSQENKTFKCKRMGVGNGEIASFDGLRPRGRECGTLCAWAIAILVYGLLAFVVVAMILVHIYDERRTPREKTLEAAESEDDEEEKNRRGNANWDNYIKGNIPRRKLAHIDVDEFFVELVGIVDARISRAFKEKAMTYPVITNNNTTPVTRQTGGYVNPQILPPFNIQ